MILLNLVQSQNMEIITKLVKFRSGQIIIASWHIQFVDGKLNMIT